MKTAELREQSTSELQGLLRETEEEKFRLRMQHYTGQLERSSRLGQTRKQIARIKTILRERELAGNE